MTLDGVSPVHRREHAQLLATARLVSLYKYTITIEWAGERYLGLTLKWDYKYNARTLATCQDI
jgi:hypothetical protein